MFGAIRGKVKTWFTVGAGTLAAVTVAGLLGAFGALPQPETPVLARDSQIETGQWLVRPLRAYVGTDRVYNLPVKQDQQALVLEVEMTNRTAGSAKDYFTLFQLAPPLGGQSEQPAVILTRDGSMTPALHPGMMERMAYVWTFPKAVALPDELPLVVNTKTYKPQDNLYGTPGWFNERELGRVEMPVEAKAAENQS
jgi:hypothetical protein